MIKNSVIIREFGQLSNLLYKNTLEELDIDQKLVISIVKQIFTDFEYIRNCCYRLHLKKVSNMIDSKPWMEDYMKNSGQITSKCGHKIKTYSNGFIVYCNKSKYFHTSFNKDGQIDDHEYKQKDPVVSKKEFYQREILAHHLKYIDKLYNALKLLFCTYIKNNFSTEYVKYTKENLTNITAEMNENSKIFKEKTFYKKKNSTELYFKMWKSDGVLRREA